MKERRMEIRWPDDDPVAVLLFSIPRGQRNKVVQAILRAALLPGGWGKLVNGQLAVANTSVSPGVDADSDLPAPPEGTPEVGMSPEGTRGFMHGLQRFLDDD